MRTNKLPSWPLLVGMGTAQGAELACGDFLAKLGKKPAHFGCQSCQSCQKYGAA